MVHWTSIYLNCFLPICSPSVWFSLGLKGSSLMLNILIVFKAFDMRSDFLILSYQLSQFFRITLIHSFNTSLYYSLAVRICFPFIEYIYILLLFLFLSISLVMIWHDWTISHLFLVYTWTRSLELEFSNLLSEFQLTFYIWKHLVQNSFLVATWPLDQAWGFQSSRNNLQWLGTTHWKPLKVLGTFGKPHRSTESLADDSRVSLTFHSIPYHCVWIWGSA